MIDPLGTLPFLLADIDTTEQPVPPTGRRSRWWRLAGWALALAAAFAVGLPIGYWIAEQAASR